VKDASFLVSKERIYPVVDTVLLKEKVERFNERVRRVKQLLIPI